MSLWLLVLLGMIGFFAASVLVGLFVAAILAKIGREACALLELEPLTGLLPGDESLDAFEEHTLPRRLERLPG